MADGTQIDSLFLTIESNSQSASDGIDTLIATLEKLKKSINNGLGLSSVATGLNNVGTSASSATKKIKDAGNATDKASQGFVNLYAKLKTAVSGFKSIYKQIGSFVTKSNEYIENINLFNVSMGKYADEAMKYAETVNDVIGIDPGEWARNQGIFMTLAKGFGVVEERAYLMSQNLTQLGYDLSSFYNSSFEEAMQKLQSGIAGELEPLRRWGYDLSKAKLEAIALSLGIDKTFNSMTQAEKAQLRYYAIMTQVTEVQGDMARTLEAPANQLRILQSQLEQLARTIGNIFIPLLNKVLPYAIAAAKVLRTIAEIIANLVGFEMPEVDYSNVNSSGVQSLTDDLDDATEAANKLKQATIGIDKLNIIGDKNKDNDGTDLSSMFDFDLPQYDFLGNAVQSKVNEITDKMKEWLGITGDIESWAELFETKLGSIFKVIGTIGAALAALKIGSAISSLIAALPGIIEKVSSIGSAISKIGPVLSGLSAPALIVVGIIAAIAAGLAYVYATHEEVRESVASAFKKLKESFVPLWELISTKIIPDLQAAWEGLMDILRPIGEWLEKAFVSIWEDMLVPVINYFAEEVIPGLTKILDHLWNEVFVPLGQFLADVFGPIIEVLVELLDGLWQNVVLPLADAIGKTLAKAWEGFVQVLDEVVIPAIGIMIAALDWLMLNVIDPIIKQLEEGLKPAVDVTFKFIKDIIGDIGVILGGLIDFLTGVFTGDWNKAWLGLVNIMVGVWNLIVDQAEGALNGFLKFGEIVVNGYIDMLNLAIAALNALFSAQLPDWLGGGTIGVTIPTIQHVSFSTVSFESVKARTFTEADLPPSYIGQSVSSKATVNTTPTTGETYRALLSILQEQNDITRQIRDKDTNVYLDSKQINNSVEKRQREQGAKIYGSSGGGVMYVI